MTGITMRSFLEPSLPGALLASVLAMMIGFFSTVEAIDCYKCTSINGRSKECEDTFDTGVSTVHLIKRECVYGYFKGTHCMKLKGKREDGTHITVRDCSDGDWGHHCGDIRYLYGNEEQRIYGCLEGCGHDGCNSAPAHAPINAMVILVPVLVFLLTCRIPLWSSWKSS